MAMICPQCSRSHDQLDCPVGVDRPVYPGNSSVGEDQWQQTPWGRILVGLLLGQGLAHGLAMLTTNGILADAKLVPGTVLSVILINAWQGFSLLIAGAVTGAGQQRGLLYGSFVGLVNGLIFLLVQMGRGEPLNEVALFGQPTLHLAFGAAGGLIGTLIWKPLPTLRLQSFASAGNVRPTHSTHLLSGPISWPRVVAGIAIVVCGVIRAQAILEFILESGKGTLAIETHLQARLFTWEIAAVITLVGSGLAGATTGNGLKQGLMVGLGSGIVLAGVHMGNPKVVLDSDLLFMGGIWVLTMGGGWFGSQLFPPVAATQRRRGIAV